MEQLYSTTNPQLVDQYQNALQEIQKSPQGANVASYLLSASSRNCRYFGALTYSVVILNNTLNDDQVKDLVSLIHRHIQDLLSDESAQSQNMFVIQKLFSNLLLLYTKYPSSHPSPILLFTAMILNLKAPFHDLIRQLSPPQLELTLIYFSTLVEDIYRANANSSALHRSVFQDILPMLITTYNYLLQVKSLNQLLYQLTFQSLKTLSAWMSYISNVNAENRYEASHVSILTQYIFLFFLGNAQDNDDEYLSIIQLCLKIFGEVFEINPTLLTLEEKETIINLLFEPASWGAHFQKAIVLSEARHEREEEVNAYVDLTLSVLQYSMIKISKTILEPKTQSMIESALRLTELDGAAFEDDLTSERMLEFWEELSNVYIDSADMFDTLFEQAGDAQFEKSFKILQKQLFEQVSRIYWKKIHIPSYDVYSSHRAEFNSYRQAVADFFLVAYSLLKSELYSMLTESLVLGSKDTSGQNLADIEASLFLLFNINDDAVYFESQASTLLPFTSKIMQSYVIQQFKELLIDDPYNRLPLSTFVQYLSSSVFFFETDSGSVHLGEIFDIMFRIIVSNNQYLSLLASKTVTRICERCSRHLVQFLPNLEVIILEMLKNLSIDGLIRLRMFNAYTVVARTVEDETQFDETLYGMVTEIRNTSSLMLATVEESGSCSDIQEEYLTSLLSCLVGVAKGCALSDEFREAMTDHRTQFYKNYWAEDCHGVKSLVLSVLRMFLMESKVVRQMPIVVEKCTLVVKAGFGEELGGPFEFGQDTVLELVETIMTGLRNPNSVPHVLSLIECFINVNYRTLTTAQVEHLTNSVVTRNMDFLKSDPDLLKGAIDIFTKIIECKPSLIIHSDFFISTILPCALDGLQANELFIVKSISKFWTNLLNLKKGTRVDQEFVSTLFEMTWGPTLSNSLLVAFLKAPRSNLDQFYTVFRSLLVKYPVRFKSWLIQSMQLDSVVALADLKERETFVNQLVLTRGRRAANDVLKGFWLKCNGLVEYNNHNF